VATDGAHFARARVAYVGLLGQRESVVPFLDVAVLAACDVTIVARGANREHRTVVDSLETKRETPLQNGCSLAKKQRNNCPAPETVNTLYAWALKCSWSNDASVILKFIFATLLRWRTSFSGFSAFENKQNPPKFTTQLDRDFGIHRGNEFIRKDILQNYYFSFLSQFWIDTAAYFQCFLKVRWETETVSETAAKLGLLSPQNTPKPCFTAISVFR